MAVDRTRKFQDASEIVFGLVLAGKLKPEQVDATRIVFPYNAALAEVGDRNLAGLQLEFGAEAINSAIEAEKTVNGVVPEEYLVELDIAFNELELLRALSRASKKLEKGDVVDLDALQKEVELHIERQTIADGDWQPLSYADIAKALPRVEWLWEPWLPKGLLTLIVGAPEIGKSGLALALADSVLTGASLPDGTRSKARGKVLWVDTEGAKAINTGRMEDWNIPMADLIAFTSGDDPYSDPEIMSDEGWDELERHVAIEGIRLIIVDSLGGAYMQENKPRVKILCKKLASLAERYQIAVVLIHHPRKLQLGEHDEITLDRIRGHSGIVQFARTVMSVEAPDPAAPWLRRVRMVKSNLTERPEPFGFEMVRGEGLVWEDAPEAPIKRTMQDQAEAVLYEILAKGPVLASEVYEQGKQAGISEDSMKRSKKGLDVESKKIGPRWYWFLQPHYELYKNGELQVETEEKKGN